MSSKAPKHLSASSRALWDELCDTYDLEDGQSQVLLLAACESRDRAEQARLQIKKEGRLTYIDRAGAMHRHPAVDIERFARAQMIACFRNLKLEPPTS